MNLKIDIQANLDFLAVLIKMMTSPAVLVLLVFY